MNRVAHLINVNVYVLTLIFLAANVAAIGAEGKSKGSNNEGLDALVVLGVISAVEGRVLTVKVPGTERNQTLDRKISLTDNTSISYLDLMDKAQQVPKVGYEIKGIAEQDRRLLKKAIFSPAIGELKPLGKERLTMSIEKLFAAVDADKDGKVSYVEFSISVELSRKHGPDEFQGTDKNKDGRLDLAEFTTRIQTVTWWKLSRKTPGEFFKSCDKDGNGNLSVKEFGEIGSGHIEAVFPRCDSNKSGGLDLQEVTSYINNMTDD